MESQSGDEERSDRHREACLPREEKEEGAAVEQVDPSANHTDFGGRSIQKLSDPWSHCLDSGGEWGAQGCLMPSSLAGPVRCEVGRRPQAKREHLWGAESQARPGGRRRNKSGIPFIPRELPASWGLRQSPEVGGLERMGKKERRQTPV